MTAVNPDDTRELGEWGLFVARVVQEIRRELGESTANRVAMLLHDQKSEAIDATREQVEAAEATLQRTLDEVADARRAHERLQADIARMNAATREAKLEASRVRSAAADDAAHRRAELDAFAEAEAARIAAAWDDLHQHEAEVANRRSELLSVEEAAEQRRAALDEMAAELAALRETLEMERMQATRIVDDAIAKTEVAERVQEINEERAAQLAQAEREIEARAASRAEEVLDVRVTEIDLRVDDIDLRERQMNERAAELDEWEADLIARAELLQRRELRVAPTPPPAGDNVAGWGRRRRED
ncbi:MAG: hypothetical protein R8F63_16305 [Acidimicrobiales bacterium]|nr:hypothetical protein [Acidimicrobiales bacterium]